jgi:ATP-binding cassette, subfamily B, bacterial MsbA
MLNGLKSRLTKTAPDGSHGTLYLYGRLFHYFRPYLFRLIVAMVITFPIGALDAVMALSLRPFLDGMRHTQTMTTVAYLLPLTILGLTLLQGVFNYFSIYLNGWLGYHVVRDLRRDLFQKLLAMEVRYFDATASGTVIQRYFKDPEMLQVNLLENTKVVLTRFFSSISLVFALVYTSWQLSIIAIIMLALILYPSTLIRRSLRKIAKELTQASGDLMSFYTDALGGIKVIQSYHLESYQIKRFDTIQHSMYDRTMRKVKAQAWLTPLMYLIAAVGISLILWQGSRMMLSGELTTGAFVSFITAMIMLYNPIKNLGNAMMNSQLSLFAAGRVFELLDQRPLVADKAEAIPLRRIREGITFENVLFGYKSPKRPVLKAFNLTIRAGETVALVGSSGSGKTTIANLIPRFYDIQEGAIKIDGVDLREYQVDSLRSRIAIVMQDNFLFNGTIRDNIMVGNVKATEEELYEAVEKAYLREFIETLGADKTMSTGLDAEIGERGFMLSGGQRQRIAIARALLKKSAIVILDEATSALDNQSEAVVQKAIESLMENKTVIVIAHRLSTVRNVDRIVLLDKGNVVEEGTHDALLSAKGSYAKLYYAQQQASPEETASDNVIELPKAVQY